MVFDEQHRDEHRHGDEVVNVLTSREHEVKLSVAIPNAVVHHATVVVE